MVGALVVHLVCFVAAVQGLAFSDKRLKENIVSADLGELLESIDKLELKEFDFIYEQFYNPVFGKRQLGVVAQELLNVFPRAVGIVEKRAVGHPNDEDPTWLENVHVFNSEALFMANVGATKQLLKMNRLIESRIAALQQNLETTSKDVEKAKTAHDALNDIKNQQRDLETLAKQAHETSLGALKLEQTLDSMEKTSETERSERGKLVQKLEQLDQLLRTEIKDQGDLHKDISVNTIKFQSSIEMLQEKLRHLQEDNQRVKESHKESMERQRETLVQKTTELERLHRNLDADMEKALKKIVSQEEAVETHRRILTETSSDSKKSKEELETMSKKMGMLSGDIESHSRKYQEEITELRKEVNEYVEVLYHNISLTDKNIRKTVDDLALEVNVLKVEVTSIKELVNKQAGEELVEQRKLTEAQVALEKEKIEYEKTRAEEERRSAKFLAEIESEKTSREINSTLTRVRQEEAIRAQRELDSIRAKEESDLKLSEQQSKQAIALEKLKAEAELKRLEEEAKIAHDTALAKAKAETERERENHDIHIDMARVEAEEKRAHTSAMIASIARETIAAMKLAVQSPEQVLTAVGILVVLAFGIYASREIMVLWRKYWERQLGQPSLVRETSMKKSQLGSSLVLPLICWIKRKSRALYLSLLGSEKDKALERTRLQEEENMKTSFRAFMSDVILPNQQADQIDRIARATRASHSNKTALRHVLFYGPPGTGKTMVARYLSKWCDLDYAIMSGADIAPLKDRAVTEIHNLFHWANKTKRGVLLFIDEADAFLASRDGAPISESLRNALTALLFHTGSASCRVMMVLATNRPGDLDRAVIDRIDESVQFYLPSERERRLLVLQYYKQTLEETIKRISVTTKMLDETALKMKGFSGREISKFMTSVQAHVYGSTSEHLDAKLFNAVLEHSVREHKKLDTFQKETPDMSFGNQFFPHLNKT